MSKPGDTIFVEPSDYGVGPKVVDGFRFVFHTRINTDGIKENSEILRSIFDPQVGQCTVGDRLVFDDYECFERTGDFRGDSRPF